MKTKMIALALLTGTLQAGLQMGGEYTHVGIKTKGLPLLDGNLGGIQALYEYDPCCDIYAGIKAFWRQGYATGHDFHRTLCIASAEERVGYSLFYYGNITLFTGFGYRYLGHTLTQEGYGSVRFNYHAFYVPVGIQSGYCVNDRLSVGCNATWMPQVFPTVEIVPLEGAFWSLTREMGNVLVEVPVTFRLTESNCFYLVVKPFYERWQDGRSTAVTSLGNALDLPSNIYQSVGIAINADFLF